MSDRTLSQPLLFRSRPRSCASCARDSIARRANVAPGKFALFASCSPDVSRDAAGKKSVFWQCLPDGRLYGKFFSRLCAFFKRVDDGAIDQSQTVRDDMI